ncbi:MAG: glycosyltransferase [Lachnospiraceae bacterium]|nr:glycosyltransferase [Lachnospiraceae bacterium]
MGELISLIVPVFNGEKWLPAFFQQFQEQTYENLELILVNDGSADNTGVIIDEYAKENKKVTVYHKDNGGPSSARNYGIKKATGKYVVFADVDDRIFPSYVEYLYDLIKRYDSDMAVCSYIKITEEEKYKAISIEQQPSVQLYTNEQAIKDFCYRKHITGYSCLKLIKRDLLEDVYFPDDIVYGEDFLFSYDILKKCSKVVFGKEIQYLYIQYGDSSTHVKRDNTEKYKKAWDKHLLFLEDVKKNYPASYYGALSKCYILAINNTQRIFDGKRDASFKKELLLFIKDNAVSVYKDKDNKKLNRILGLMGAISARGTCKLCEYFFKLQDVWGITLRHTT